MPVNSRYLRAGSPTCCAFCQAQFPTVDGHYEAWRASNGEYYCTEICADDAERAAFSHRRKAG